MTVRVPKISFTSIEAALRELVQSLSSVIRDEAKPYRWDDVWMLGDAIANTVKPPVFSETEYAWEFTPSSTSIFAGCVQMPHKMKQDGPETIVMVPHLHMYSRTAAASTASAKTVWRFRWRWYPSTGNQPTGWNERTVTFTDTASAGRMIIASFGTATASVTVGTSSLFKFEIAKLPAGGNRTIYLDQADTHIRFDTDRGSQLETEKWAT